VFNANFNNISVISWPVTDKLYHIMLYTSRWSRFILTSVMIGDSRFFVPLYPNSLCLYTVKIFISLCLCTTAYASIAYHHWCEYESRSARCVQQYVIKFVSDRPRYNWYIVEIDIKHHQTNICAFMMNWTIWIFIDLLNVLLSYKLIHMSQCFKTLK
jgi:hypothetical protein